MDINHLGIAAFVGLVVAGLLLVGYGLLSIGPQGADKLYQICKYEDISVKALGGKALSEYTTAELLALPQNKRLVCHVVLNTNIRKDEIYPIVEEIVSDSRRTDPDIDLISVALYTDCGSVGQGFDIGSAEWAPYGDWDAVTLEIARTNDRTNYQLVLELRDDLEEYLAQVGRVETQHRLTYKERRELYAAIVVCEDKAFWTAQRHYYCEDCPEFIARDLLQHGEMQDRLESECYQRLASKYGITIGELNEVGLEGLEQNWPMPEPLPLPACCQ